MHLLSNLAEDTTEKKKGPRDPGPSKSAEDA
jgi:hypothetical protein